MTAQSSDVPNAVQPLLFQLKIHNWDHQRKILVGQIILELIRGTGRREDSHRLNCLLCAIQLPEKEA